MDFAKRREQAEKAGLIGGGDYLKLKEGGNRIRLMSDCLPHPGEYQGKKNFKWLCYVLDRTDGKVKAFFMAHTIYKQIEALQMSEDYSFDDTPMPYDVTVSADGAGTKEVKYAVMPARKNSAVTSGELALLHALKPLEDLQKSLKEKKAGDEHAGQEHQGEQADNTPLDDSEIPF